MSCFAFLSTIDSYRATPPRQSPGPSFRIPKTNVGERQQKSGLEEAPTNRPHLLHLTKKPSPPNKSFLSPPPMLVMPYWTPLENATRFPVATMSRSLALNSFFKTVPRAFKKTMPVPLSPCNTNPSPYNVKHISVVEKLRKKKDIQSLPW